MNEDKKKQSAFEADVSRGFNEIFKEIYASVVKELIYTQTPFRSIFKSCLCSHARGDQQRVERLLGTWQKCTCGKMKRKKQRD